MSDRRFARQQAAQQQEALRPAVPWSQRSVLWSKDLAAVKMPEASS